MLGTSFPVVGHRHALGQLGDPGAPDGPGDRDGSGDLKLSPEARDLLLNGTARRLFGRLENSDELEEQT